MTPELIKNLDSIEDPRNGNAIRHKLIDIMFIAICTVLCGDETWKGMEMFGKIKEEWLRKFLELPNGIPSEDTFRRVLSRLKPVEFQRLFFIWVEAIKKTVKKEIIAIDGKRVRRSFDKQDGKEAIHVISAWAKENGLILGQVTTDAKSNEITAIPMLLEIIDLKDAIVTIDAMGTQKTIAKEIIDRKGDYVLALKGNQGTLHEDVKYYFEQGVIGKTKKEISLLEKELAERNCKMDYHKTVDKGHGRIEIRQYYQTNDIEWLSQKNDWKKLKSMGMVISQREIGGKRSVECRYYISSIDIDAALLAKAIRGHWEVENKVHWILDVSYSEDASRIRKGHGAENLAVLRRMTLNMLNRDVKNKKISLRKKRFFCALDEKYLEKIVFL